MTFTDPRLAALDGFRVEIDAARERADVILDRPPFNIVSMPQRDQLRLVFEALDEDARVRVIVLRAIGEHFSSGGNIKGFMEATPETVSKLAWNIAAPARCAKPVIVANRGFCFGVGFELSLACDFRLVSETCFYALPEQRLGQIPGSGGSARLQKIVGITRTKDIVMRSKRIPGKQAHDWGIATECVPDAQLEKRDRRAGRRAAHLLAARAAHRQEAAQRHRGFHALDRDRARRPLLQPAAPVGRFPRRRRGVPRQARREIQGKLTMKWCRYSIGGETCYGLIEGETVRKVDGIPWERHTVTGRASRARSREARVAGDPGTFFCVGVNYRDHVDRMAAKRGTEPSYPPRPDIGYRANNALIAHGRTS